MSYPKTIIITAVPNRSGNDMFCRRNNFPGNSKPNLQGKPNSVLGENTKSLKIISMHHKKSIAMINDDIGYHPTRKRQRLDHLSMEEKVMRRKLKNRVAAQSARDRKKMKMDELEVVVQQLESEKADLMEENDRLKNLNLLLETENQYLKNNSQEASAPTQGKILKQEPKVDDVRVEKVAGASVEHASLISDPQPKGQELLPLPSPWMTPFACLQMIMSLISLSYSTNAEKTFSKMPSSLEVLQILNRLLQEQDSRSLHRLLKKWWGPQQKTWSPSKN